MRTKMKLYPAPFLAFGLGGLAVLAIAFLIGGCDGGSNSQNVLQNRTGGASLKTLSDKPEDLNKSTDPKCGPRSLWVAAGLMGISKDLEELCDLSNMTSDGTTLLDLKTAAEMIGLEAKGVKCQWQDLVNLNSPAILSVYGEHFVCVDPREQNPEADKTIRVYDLPKPTVFVGQKDLEAIWNGEALLLQKGQNNNQNRIGTQTAETKPKVSFSYTYADFGIVKEDNVMTHSYTLINDGDSPLKILGLKKSCGCAALGASRMEIPPSGQVDIKMAFDLHGRHGDQMVQGAVQTNDPENPLVMLSYRGFVEKPVLITPYLFDFGEVVPGQTLTRTVVVTDRGDQTLQWRKGWKTQVHPINDLENIVAVDQLPNMQFTYVSHGTSTQKVYTTAFGADPDRPDKFQADPNKLLEYRFEMKSTIPIDAKLGRYAGSLDITGFRQYDNANYPISIPLALNIVDDVLISHSTVSFGLMTPGVNRTKRVYISSRTKKHLDIDNLSPKGVELTLVGGTNVEIVPTVTISQKGGSQAILDVTLELPRVELDAFAPIKGRIVVDVEGLDREIMWVVLPSPNPSDEKENRR